jgi:hypothetical protein
MEVYRQAMEVGKMEVLNVYISLDAASDVQKPTQLLEHQDTNSPKNGR